MSIEVLVVYDHDVMLSNWQSLIKKHPGIKVVGGTKHVGMAAHLARELKPEVVIMDLKLPDIGSISTIREINTTLIGVKVIVLSLHLDQRFVREVFKAGAKGLLMKDSAFDGLANAIQTVIAGQIFLCSETAEFLAKEYLGSLLSIDNISSTVLTARQREVLQLLTEGKSTKQIAASLNVSVKTVETHRQNVMMKLDIHTIAGLTKLAIRDGLTSLDI